MAVPDPIRLFSPKGHDRVAVVSVEPAYGRSGVYLVRVARGVKLGKLTGGKTYGPYAEAELAEPFALLVEQLRQEGFMPPGVHSALEGLFSDSAKKRGRSATRLGWRGGEGAVEALLAALPKASDEACAILDALGRLGDVRAIPAIRPHAARKLLSRRRSAVEALRNLNDTAGLAEVRQRTLEQLPQPVRDVLSKIDESQDHGEGVAQLVAAAKACEAQRHGLIADLLYELATPAAVTAAVQMLSEMQFERAYIWRYTKSILKRSMLRGDARTFGALMHQIERQGRESTGTSAIVKSGYDGVDRSTGIFRTATQNYLRRSGWRHLRQLALYRSDAYAASAAEAIIHYNEDDLQEPDGRYGALSRCYLLHRVLLGGSSRFSLESRSLRFRVKSAKHAITPPNVREEAFPELWDRHPQAYVRVLAAGRLVDVQQFAYAGYQRHPAIIKQSGTSDLLGMLDAPFQPTVDLAIAEIGTRLDPAKPDWDLITRLAADARGPIRELGQRFIRDTVPLWTRDIERTTALLLTPEALTRALVAELVLAALPGAGDPSLHRRLAERLLAELHKPESSPGLHESLARVLREGLHDTIAPMLEMDALLNLIAHGSPSAQAVAGDLLGARPEAIAALGLEKILSLAQHSLAAVRGAGQVLIRSAREHWHQDPAVLLSLAESSWQDTRSVALDLLRTQVASGAVTAEMIMGLLDSNLVDVQQSAQDLARAHFAKLDAATLTRRLVEHPHPAMRSFAMELVTQYLPDNAASIAQVEGFFRTILLDLWPQRRLKNQVITFLAQRGTRDLEQARIAARILAEPLQTEGYCDFEPALEALVRLKLAWPELDAGVALAQTGGAA